MKTQNYTQFGEAWKKEVMKFPKKELVNWLANALQESLILKQKLDEKLKS